MVARRKVRDTNVAHLGFTPQEKAITMRMLTILAAASVAILATPAFAGTSITTTRVNMRAAPDTGAMVLTTLPPRAEVVTHGCLDNLSWCEVSWGSQRGWVSSSYTLTVQDHEAVVVNEPIALLPGVNI